MTLRIDRRSLLQIGTLGLGALATPGAGRLLTGAGFTHQVASGEPGPTSVLLWTRYVSEGEPTLRAEVAEDLEFGRIVGRGEGPARNEGDFTAKITVGGLSPGRWYYYRFVAPDGTSSPTGRTRTLPEGPVDRFAIGVFSCANMPFGHFNAYAHAAMRNDLDLIVHTGDYLYEYPRGTYPAADASLPGRIILPEGEIIALADYRLRYASYRADPDLAALHRNFPMIAQWDDHEFSNDAWQGGAENHDPTEGGWAARKRAAERAWREWMPVSDERWSSYRIGTLATLMRAETRISGRSEQLSYAAVARSAGDDVAGGLAAFRDGAWQDPARSMLGAEQEAWLEREIMRSVSEGARWQLLSQQTVMSRINFPLPIAEQVMSGGSEQARQRAGLLALAAREGLPLNLDAWDGYPAARDRLLGAALEAGANLVVLSGDSHNGWAGNLDLAGTPAGVEMAGHSVTSPGFEAALPRMDPQSVARAVVEASPNLAWADTARRGYLTVTLTPDAARGEWHFLDGVRERSTTMAGSHSIHALHGTNRFAV
ncbi:MAG: alkaline phosphatase [Parasphingopyxis sp.]|nr:alkaline phosphatase D family protein [Sphingomonadales bacterium]